MVRRASSGERGRIVHPLFVRVTHWINAFAVIAMLMSGLRIYNAAPLYEFRFPPEVTLGGWLAGALAWHFAVMWLLLLNGVAYIVYGFASGHFIRRLFDIGAISAYRNVKLELRHLLIHGTGEYNLIQRLLYVVVILDVALLFLSGLALWKPVQLQDLAAWMGGYEGARRVHFFGMTILALFIFVHVSVAFAIKGSISSMLTGRLPEKEDKKGKTP
jgi:thiosulfate reductase cytochrome b subunit